MILILFAQWTHTFYLQMSDVMEQNEVRSSKCIEGNGSHHLTNHESKLYSGSALSSLQISQQDQVSLKRDHPGNESTVKDKHLKKLDQFYYIIIFYFSKVFIIILL